MGASPPPRSSAAGGPELAAGLVCAAAPVLQRSPSLALPARATGLTGLAAAGMAPGDHGWG